MGMNSKKIIIGSLASSAEEAKGIVVVIDVFRAFTTAAVAFTNGAEKIVLVDDLDTALSYREEGIGDYCIGERGGNRPQGFDFGNSPSEILDVSFEGRTLIQTTSNGTRGILAAAKAQKIYAGSFATAEGTIKAIENSKETEVSLVAMGNGNERADEDEICALYLRSRLLGLKPYYGAVKSLIRTMSKRIDGNTISPGDFDCCMKVGSSPFAIRVSRESNLWVATAETV